MGSLSALLKGSSEGSGEETTLKSLFESRTTTDKKPPAVAPETEEDGKQSLDGEGSEMKAKAVKKSKRPDAAKKQREALCRAFANAVLTQTKKGEAHVHVSWPAVSLETIS